MPKDDKPQKSESPTKGQEADRDVQQLQELYDIMVSRGLDLLEVKENGQHVRLNRQRTAVPQTAVPRASAAQDISDGSSFETPPSGNSDSNDQSIMAPLAGVFYRASSPTSAPFVKEGDIVESGQTLCIVEAMKVMNEIKAEARCRIVRILAENARPVTASQPLFAVESA
jgi:acetyl-CoA carboxylase biotin carboxyl carrier protein